MKVDVMVMAGGKCTELLRQCSQMEYEALIEINGVPMVKYVVDAARHSQSIGRIAVIGPVELLEPFLKDDVDLFISGQERLVDNVREGMQALGGQRKVLILSSDVPLISPQVIDSFVERCLAREADFYYPIVSKENNLQRFPGTKRTYARLRDGVFTGGNIFVMNPAIVEGALGFMQKMIIWRKQPLKLCQAFGWKYILKLVLGRLTIAELEERVHHLTGYSAAALVMEFPEVGFDVDKPSDLEMMRLYLKPQNLSGAVGEECGEHPADTVVLH